MRTPADPSRDAGSNRDDANDGVDVSLIDWMLSLTPEQRVQALQSWVNAVQAFRHGR